LAEAIASGWLAPLGPNVDAFEREMCERLCVPFAVALSSGTAALHLALLVLGISAGDRVWCSTLTFAATANAIRYTGATPVFIDSELTSWNLDPNIVTDELDRAARTGRLPKALIAVDLYGQCADFEPIATACRRHGVYLIEDAAESLGATYMDRPAGSLGDLAILSFNGNKIITTSGGGMLVGRRADWIERARWLASQAREPTRHYEHRVVGYNYRLSNLLAAVGRVQLADLDRRIERRRAINARYRTALGSRSGWSFAPEASYGRSTFWLTSAVIDPAGGETRDDVIERLASRDIEARPVWKPLHLQPVFRECERFGGGVAEQLFDRGVCLPSGSNLRIEDQEHVIATIRGN
jgi:pyridoxal phosphate-dependent aminotransferase EpsN